jgi:hypothetical protein
MIFPEGHTREGHISEGFRVIQITDTSVQDKVSHWLSYQVGDKPVAFMSWMKMDRKKERKKKSIPRSSKGQHGPGTKIIR